ncbi:MAG TPA: heme-binding protein [Caulobacteraceae bacterium]
MTNSPIAPATIGLPPAFHFNEVRSLPDLRLKLPVDFPPALGALTNFTGSWSGSGFNIIFRPQSTQTPTQLPHPGQGPNDNILELNLTAESLAFSGSLGSVPNRGMVQGDIFLNGIPYLQTVSDVTNGAAVGIHVEPGLWMAVPSTTNPHEPATLVRMASIPHGTTINLQGGSTGPTAGKPTIPALDPTPFFSATRLPQSFPSQTAANASTFRIPQDLTSFIAAGTITQAMLNDPNSFLRNHIASQTIVETTTIEVASAPQIPADAIATPAAGGGADNIAFLTTNADVPVVQAASHSRTLAGVKATFWIETVEHLIHLPVFQVGQPPLTLQAEGGGPTFKVQPPKAIPAATTITVRSTQIQYSQVVLLNFNGLTWPHVSVATLTPADPVSVTPVNWAAVVKA